MGVQGILNKQIIQRPWENKGFQTNRLNPDHGNTRDSKQTDYTQTMGIQGILDKQIIPRPWEYKGFETNRLYPDQYKGF